MISGARSDMLLRKGLKLSHLRLMAVLADTEQLTQAAAVIGVSQPAASRLVTEIERIIGPIEIAAANEAQDDAAQPAPGMLSRHYAPATRLVVIGRDQVAEPITGLRCGLLTEGTRRFSDRFVRIETLCSDGNLQTCATNFFAAMRTLDAADLDVIIAHEFPGHGLGIALNDRLRRAAH